MIGMVARNKHPHTIFLDDDTYRLLREMSDHFLVSRSAVVRGAIKFYYSNYYLSWRKLREEVSDE